MFDFICDNFFYKKEKVFKNEFVQDLFRNVFNTFLVEDFKLKKNFFF